ncbi:MAG: thioesterase domain-containing protein, partial [Acidobacteria bacterium]|nr:thioesterase domain-containing protein [Acidobacteriota bacterium]
MRILLAHNSTYYPAHGGGDKSNRLLLEALAQRGHGCRVVARTASYGADVHARYLAELAARGIAAETPEPGVAAFRLGGVEVRVATSHPHLRGYFAAQMSAFEPDVVIASTDDPAQVLLEAALGGRARVVYLVRATLAVPFGPDSAFPSASKTGRLREADAVVGVSRYVAEYVRRHSGIAAVHVPISLLDPGPWPDLGRYDNEFVTLVNPCAVKGISILLALAGRMPGVRFAAVPTWGTNEQDRAALAEQANITVLDPVDNIDRILERTRALLVPSLWAEARSRIVVEAMLRGVPVLASGVGGIPEAKMGVRYLLPVRPIARYQARLDEQMVPVAEVPEQDAGPWQAALEELLGSRDEWETVARESRRAALEYAAGLNVEPFEEVLRETLRAPRRQAAPVVAPRADALSPEKRRLLELRLKKKAAGAWFRSLDLPAGARTRLICLPHAGGGTAAYQRWAGRLGAEIAVYPAILPGRETRGAEKPFDCMESLVEALGTALLPHAGAPFALFGHSMGAAIGFELARWLRRRQAPLPFALLVSAARAPQFRRNYMPPPDPSDEQFLAELRRLEGGR